MKRICLTIALALYYIATCAQSNISGKVFDENENPLTGATVVLLETGDSTIIAFSITGGKGEYQFDNVDQDSCIIQASFISYSSYTESIALNDGAQNLPDISLFPSSAVLQEVTLKAEHIPMGIRGDTISYNAAAFMTKPGDSVEDLLKKMPGIEVARDGSIKAQGEDVENVLVDGKEFFGNDPTIATKNLEAEAVDKVQVYDKQSEISEFTGIEDGQEEKTINLKLKEEFKNGGFGRIEAGGGSEDRYMSKLNYNRFSPSYQASILAAGNNINEQSFSFNDYISFMGGLSQAMANSSGVFSFNEFGGAEVPEGLNTDLSGGLNFNMDVSDKFKFRTNYFLLSTENDLEKTISSLQFRGNDEFSSFDSLRTTNKTTNHRLNTRLEYAFTPLTELIFKLKLLAVLNNDEEVNNTLLSFQNGLENIANSNWLGSNEEFGYSADLQFRKKFLKKGRSFIASLNTNQSKNDLENNVFNSFVLSNSADGLIQNQFLISDQSSINLSSNYTEPLGNQYYASFNIGLLSDRENADKDFFDLMDGTELFNELFSRDFIKDFRHVDFGVKLKRNRRKLKTTLGLDYKVLDWSLSSQGEALDYEDRYNYTLPSFILDWEVGRNTSISTNYLSSVQVPSLRQLMPVIDNVQANYSVFGNPELIPEYNHDIRINLNYFDNFSFTNFFMNFGHSITRNRIVNAINIDDNLLKSVLPINSDRFNSSYAFLSFSKPIRALKTKYRISSQLSRSSYDSFVNAEQSGVNEKRINAKLIIENIKKERFDLLSGVAIDLTDRAFSLNEDFNQTFFNYSLFVDAQLYITDDFTLSASYDHTKYSSEFFSDDTEFGLLNMSIKKSFSDQTFSVEFKAFDLLGQNIGLRRLGGLTSLNESRFNTLERYYMISMSYRLGKRKKKEGIQF